ncbi:8-amino-7-oxononanoate synthase [Dactylosporangium matsuzakiense]|uniref:8-amino-7-oxononanoate synthase n=1 Tax=Dactylosporangium matsuzakiense TaxID=53360 RepID=A0A9W6KI87_9ACTN|nr:aminotransferase class I/II-fold pyridoxal phosphate-dependent enzyme [Dactylosporangium matsuzakiense]UWZ43307.1 aminotransferase class I/II-fold pyridoxal phosphate-dependent enzyme [Dactylosporangium matsuzakiense]GLL02582.1 8-amino-7-oxononanoate synthase [Dactylosporangium matsuzakiense]
MSYKFAEGEPIVEWLEALDEEAAARLAAGLRRETHPRDSVSADLAGNDYLGLSRHPAVLAAAAAALHTYGLGATGSRLVRGSTDVHRELEESLAGLLGCAASLVYSSGYLANLGAVRALARPGALIVSDAHNHASIVDACRLARGAGREGVETVVAPHADPAAVAAILAAHPGRPALVVTESIFSVDGDLAPLPELYEIARSHGALMLVDDAHALGVLGPRGAGGAAAAGLAGAPGLVVTATLSKSLGAAGGVIAGPEQLHRQLVDTGRTFIFDTALPPAVAAGALAALRLLAEGDDLRAGLHARAARAVDRLRGEGLEVSTPAGGVISVAAPGPDEALAWATACRDRGVAVGCFRPPSTPDGRSRLRLTVNVGIPADAFDEALDVILKERP